jgi:hypothetical protein
MPGLPSTTFNFYQEAIMNFAQLIVTIVIVVVVGAGVAFIATTNQPDMGAVEKRVSELEAGKGLVERQEDRINALTAKIDALSAGSEKTVYPAVGDIKQKLTALNTRMDKLETQFAELIKKMETETAAKEKSPEKSLTKLFKGIASDDPEKAMKEFAKSDLGKGFMKMGKQRYLSRMKSQLKLDETQTERVKELVDKGFEKMMGAWSKKDENLTEEEKREQMKVLMEDFDTSMREILDDEQYENFKKMQQQRGGGFRMGPGGRGPGGGGSEE